MLSAEFLEAIGTWALAAFAFFQYREGKQSSQRQLRAYISIHPKTVDNFGSINRTTIVLPIRNHGQTPAFNVRCKYKIAIFRADLPENFGFPDPDGSDDTNFTVFPDGEDYLRLDNDRIFSAAEVAAVFSGLHRLHIWGVASYEDAFRQTRTTRFTASVGGREFQSSVTWIGRGQRPGFGWNYGKGTTTRLDIGNCPRASCMLLRRRVHRVIGINSIYFAC